MIGKEKCATSNSGEEQLKSEEEDYEGVGHGAGFPSTEQSWKASMPSSGVKTCSLNLENGSRSSVLLSLPQSSRRDGTWIAVWEVRGLRDLDLNDWLQKDRQGWGIGRENFKLGRCF